MKATLTILLIWTASFGVITNSQENNQRSSAEQSDFGAEDENWERPVPVPDDVLRVLREIRQASPEELPADWLLASEVHLDGPNETDLIVMGMRGLRLPHAALFWVFRKTPTGHKLVLSTGGDSLSVLKARSNGYRQIRVYNNTASTTTGTIYRFSGLRYVQSHSLTKPIA